MNFNIFYLIASLTTSVYLPESDVSGCASAMVRMADTANKLKQILKSELNDIFTKQFTVSL